MPFVAPSILAADWATFGEALEIIQASGASMVHMDVMDGHFVPEISIGLPVVASLRKATELPIEVHLLIERPERFVEDFLQAGADRLCVHYEATNHLPGILDFIRGKNAKAGVALTYPTTLDAVSEILGEIDFLTILCGEPTLRDQPAGFIPRSTEKIRGAAKARRDRRLDFAIQAEGGIGAGNLQEVAAAGADILVAGSDIFNSVDPRTRLTAMVRAAQGIPGTSVA
ncbi:MAG: ribulose-phosphate 3-epimerase [Acidobacteria bacterium]|nr:ribulose-phosphate 3-epimerase [Acidobacteriota bacterium]